MKMFVICDNNDTFTGLRLVGVDGRVARTFDELTEAAEAALADREIGLLLINEKLAKQFPKFVDEIKLKRTLPLLVEIPDRHGSARGADFITKYVREAIGVKL